MPNRFLVVLSIVLLGTCMLAHGQYDQPSQQSGQSQSGSATSSPTDVTIEGCLQASGGSYTLTDGTSGKTYQLQGDTSKMSAHVGHQVSLTGTTSGPSSSAAGGMTSSASGSDQPTFVVSKLKHIATTCKSSNK